MSPDFTYHTPSARQLLILPAFLYLLNISRSVFQRFLKAGLLGEIFIGIVFGSPLAGWLEVEWQETFVVVGWVGLLLLVYEGGITTSLPTLLPLLPLSLSIALTGLLTPIALSFLLTPLFSFPPLSSFAAASALSSTSLGTTLAVLASSSIGIDLRQTKLGTALIGAAVMDDVVAFVLSEIMELLGAEEEEGLGAPIGRAVGVTVGLAAVAIPLARWGFKPAYNWALRSRWGEVVRGERAVLGFMMIFGIGAVAASEYAGTSPLYGVYVAGLVLSYLQESTSEVSSTPDLMEGHPNLFRSLTYPSSRPSSTVPLTTPSPPNPTPRLAFAQTFHHLLAPLVEYLLLPIFFASIGYSIPFLKLFRREIIWKGVVYSLLMILGKGVCGVWLFLPPPGARGGKKVAVREEGSLEEVDLGAAKSERIERSIFVERLPGALLLGGAMIARGEIGLLIAQIAYQTPTPLLSEDQFLITIWAILLCTVVGPIGVGWVLKTWGRGVVRGGWD